MPPSIALTSRQTRARTSSEFHQFVGEFLQFLKLDREFANDDETGPDVKVRGFFRKVGVRAGGHDAPPGGHVLELLETLTVKYRAAPTPASLNTAGIRALAGVNAMRTSAGGTVYTRWWLYFVPSPDDARAWRLAGAQWQPEGGEVDIATQVDWIDRVLALRTDCGAVYMVAARFRHGKGVQKDVEAAFRLLRDGAALSEESRRLDLHYPKMFRDGSAVLCNLGDHYENGLGVPPDLGQALYWYRRSAEKENCVAEFSLGTLYAEGKGVERDLAAAIEWFERASEHGSSDARVALGALADARS